MAACFLRAGDPRDQCRWHSAFYDECWQAHMVTSARFYWPHRPALIHCGRGHRRAWRPGGRDDWRSRDLCCCCLVAKLPLTLCDPMNCCLPASSVHYFPLLTFMSVKLVMTSNHLIFCHPLLLLPSVFPHIRVFSNKSALCIRWSYYWSFSFSISYSNEYSVLISFGID